jgi:hypothetical protein
MSIYAENSDDDCLVPCQAVAMGLGYSPGIPSSAMKDRRAAEALPRPIVLCPSLNARRRHGARQLRIGSIPQHVRCCREPGIADHCI